MAVWMMLIVFIILMVTTSGTNQNDCMIPLEDISSIFGQENISSPSLGEYPGETKQSCIGKCCLLDSCNIVKFRVSNSVESPNCVFYSCHPTNSCTVVTEDAVQFFTRHQPPDGTTLNVPGSIDATSPAPDSDISTLTSPRATPISSPSEQIDANRTPNASIQTSPLTPIPSDTPFSPVSNIPTPSIPDTSITDELSLTTISSPSLPSTEPPRLPSSEQSGLPSTNLSSLSSATSPNVQSTETSSLPSTDSPDLPSINSPSLSSISTSILPSIESLSSSLPSTYAPSLPSTYAPSLPSTYKPISPSNDSPSVPSSDSPYIPSPDTLATSIISSPSPDSETNSENAAINPTVTTTEASTTNPTSSDTPVPLVPSDTTISTSSSPVNSEETNSLLPIIASLDTLTPLNQQVTPDSKTSAVTELQIASSHVTPLESTAIVNDPAGLMDVNKISDNGTGSQNSSIVSAELPSTATATSAASDVPSGEVNTKNATFSTNGLLPDGTSEAMLALLVCSLTFGCVFLLTVVAVLGKRIYDGYQKRHYSRLDYLINGMYN